MLKSINGGYHFTSSCNTVQKIVLMLTVQKNLETHKISQGRITLKTPFSEEIINFHILKKHN